LEFQLEDDENTSKHVRDFICNVYTICEMILPKKNTLYVQGDPSSGKNWIFDSLFCFYLNVGNIANFNRNSQFPLNDCANRRLCCWNEPNFTDSAEDSIKMILGGDPCPMNIKNLAHYVMPRTPCILTSNPDVLRPASRPYFQERCISYLGWLPLPWPKLPRKPHPLVWRYLFDKYK